MPAPKQDLSQSITDLVGLLLVVQRGTCNHIAKLAPVALKSIDDIGIQVWRHAFYFQERERQRQEEAEQRAREEAEAEKKRRDEEEAAARALQEAAEKEAALERRRREKAMALGAEPEKGPDVTSVCAFHLQF